MPRNIDDMLVPEKKRSIRDIPIPESRRSDASRFTPQFADKEYNLPPLVRDDVNTTSRESAARLPSRSSGKKGLWITFILILLAAGAFAALSFMGRSTLSYVPKSAAVSFDKETFSAQKSGSSTLLFSVVKFSKSKGIESPATGEREVSRRANGTLVVYNTGKVAQRLRETTRFETPEGKVYRTPQVVVVPAGKVVDGEIIPGSAEVLVEADEAGEAHNIGLSDFTLPGLAGTPEFETVYARSKTAISGGFVGKEKIVSDSDLSAARSALEASLKEELLAEVRGQVPEDFVLFPSLSHVSFEGLPQTSASTAGSVIVNLRGDLYAVTFKKTDLSTYLSAGKVTLRQNELVDIVPIESLQLDFSGFDAHNLPLADTISFSVSGSAVAVWHTDEVALRADLLGKHKRDVVSILNNYPSIVSATASVRPFWKNSFPENGEKIIIKKLPVN